MGLLDSLFGRGWVKCQKRGDNYSQQKQWGLARGEYLEALRLFSSKGPEDDMARLQIKEQLGLVHHHLLELYLEKAQALERNDPRKAIQVLSDALEFAPEDRKESLLQRVAELEMSLSRPSPQVRRPEPGPVVSDEEELFNVFLADMPDSRADVYEAFGASFRKGYLALMQGRLEEAEGLLLPFLEREPNSAWLQYELGRLRLAQGRFKDALALLDPALAQLPDQVYIHHTLVQALWGLRDWARAERVLEDAFHINASLLENFLLAGETCLRSGEYDNGVELMQEGLSQHPQAVQLFRLLAALQVARKNVPAALEALESVLKLRWSYNYEAGQLEFDRESAFMAASLYLQHKLNLGRAEELFRALVSTPDKANRPVFLLGLGESLLLQNNAREARTFLTDAAAHLPEGSPARARAKELLDKAHL
jgi:tetratricopeptide (TPR) repeat protein